MVVELREAYIRLINADTWAPIERQITPRGGPTVTSKITPVNEAFDETYHHARGVEGKRYGQTGLGSMGPRARRSTSTARAARIAPGSWTPTRSTSRQPPGARAQRGRPEPQGRRHGQGEGLHRQQLQGLKDYTNIDDATDKKHILKGGGTQAGFDRAAMDKLRGLIAGAQESERRTGSASTPHSA
ncbi:MAG: hypothetical protein IT385_00215 [Deltaproteobacteria bacterium]|nr:hypothetical protein [Deltaproteobacteria bacterium]